MAHAKPVKVAEEICRLCLIVEVAWRLQMSPKSLWDVFYFSEGDDPRKVRIKITDKKDDVEKLRGYPNLSFLLPSLRIVQKPFYICVTVLLMYLFMYQFRDGP